MAYQLSTLVTNVQTKLDDTGFSSATIVQFINDTQREIFNTYRLRFMEKQASFTGTAGQASIGSLPADYQVAIDLRITSPINVATKLQFIDYKELDQIDPANNLTNLPRYAYEFGTVLNTYPTASSILTYMLRYWAIPTELVADGDVPQIPAEFQELLVLGAFKRCSQLNDSYDEAAVVQVNDFDPLLQRMVQRFAVRRHDGPLTMKTNRRAVSGGWR